MSTLLYTKTFTEVQENTLTEDGQWHSNRITEPGIDESINTWVDNTEVVIHSVFTSVDHAMLDDKRVAIIRYVVTYSKQAAQKAITEAVTQHALSPEVQSIIQHAPKENYTMSDPGSALETVQEPEEGFQELETVEEAEAWRDEHKSTLEAAREEAEETARLLQAEKVLEQIPTKTKRRKVVSNPSPPIPAEIPSKQQMQQVLPSRRRKVRGR